MRTVFHNTPNAGLAANVLDIPVRSVAGGVSNLVLGAMPLAVAEVAIYEAYVSALDRTGLDAAAYKITAAAKYLPARQVRATGTLTSSGNFTDTQTVTIGSKVYTFKTTITSADGDVAIGADRTASHANLKAAINLETGAGTKYGANTTLHPTVEATAADATTTSVRAKSYGTAGNSIATTETQTNASWGGANLSGGLDSGVQIGSTSAVFTAEDDSGWNATLAVNGTDGTMELKVTSDGSNATEFKAVMLRIA